MISIVLTKFVRISSTSDVESGNNNRPYYNPKNRWPVIFNILCQLVISVTHDLLWCIDLYGNASGGGHGGQEE